MARRSLQLWKKFFEEENQSECFRPTGVLWMAEAEDPSMHQARSIFDRLGIVYDWLDATGISERYPQFKIPDDTVAIFEPDAGALLAERSVEAVIASALRDGVRYATAHVKAPALNESRLKSVETLDGRRFSADQFLFACGSWLPGLFNVLKGVIRPTRQDLFFFEVSASHRMQPEAMPIWIDQTDAKIAYGFPDLGNGLKMGFHRLGPAYDPDMPSDATESSAISEAAHYVKHRFPALGNIELKKTHVCHYENTAYGDFLIDQHPETENVWFIGGGSGHGFKHGPAIAEYVVDALERRGQREYRFSLAAKHDPMGERVL
jgi:glycine/D-amino acid oxidase-like deaminating enzyme